MPFAYYWTLPVHQVADALVAKLLPQVQHLSVGMPEDDCDITPVISESSANFIEGLVKDAREKGENSPLSKINAEKAFIEPRIH